MDISFTRLPWYGQLGAFLALGLATCGLFLYSYETPQRAQMAGRETTLLALRVDIDKGRATAIKLKDFQRDVSALEGRLSELRAVLPEEKDAAELLRAMQGVALQSHLTITSFKPSPVVIKASHAEWPINLELIGTYHNLALFFDRVGRFARIVNISSLAVHAREGPLGIATIKADCVATTFVLLDKAGVPDATGVVPKKVA
jgi:type IV pilus assembly protein PilO